MKSRRPRDSQRSKLYAAEEILNRFKTQYTHIWECEYYLSAIFATDWFKTRYGNVVVHFKVSDGRGRRRPAGIRRGHTAWMTLPKWSRKDWIILHELAHGLQPENTAWHGPEFCRIYLQLVTRFMGKEAGDALRESFEKHKVRYRIYRNHILRLPPKLLQS